jgi:hypothetical protein
LLIDPAFRKLLALADGDAKNFWGQAPELGLAGPYVEEVIRTGDVPNPGVTDL